MTTSVTPYCIAMRFTLVHTISSNHKPFLGTHVHKEVKGNRKGGKEVWDQYHQNRMYTTKSTMNKTIAGGPYFW